MTEKYTNTDDKETRFSRFFPKFPFLGYLPPYEFKKFMILFDIYTMIVAFVFVILFKNVFGKDPMEPMSYIVFFPLVILVWVSLLYFLGMYRLFKTKRIRGILFIIFKAAVIGNILWVSYMYVFDIHYVTVRFMFFTFFITAVFITTEKLALTYLFRYHRKKGINFRRILIVGSGKRAQHFLYLNNENTEWGIKIVGLIDDEKKIGTTVGDIRVIGALNDIPKILEEHVIDEVVFILPKKWLSHIDDYILLCEKVGVRASVAADLFTPAIAKLRTTDIYGLPFLTIDTVHYNILLLYIKRLIDVITSSIALIINLPILIICAIAIKLTSPGPVFYTQKRVGLRGRIFTLYKFRSMIVGADSMLNDIRKLDESDGPVFHSRSDPRVTPVGRILRMTSFDELPQLINVLKGDMSLIGPRPPLPEETVQYELWQKRRLSLRPGIVCTWQVTHRFESAFHKWVQMDLEYIDNWSLALDFKILLKVLPAILKGLSYWRAKKG